MQESASQSGGSEIDAVELVEAMWSARWLVAMITGLTTLLCLVYVLVATPWFRAEVVLVAANNKDLPGGLAQFGGLASLAGINLGTQAGTEEAVAVLKSREFVHDFIVEKNLLTVLFADEWDATAKKWKKQDPLDQPDIRDAVDYFDKDVRSVDEDKKSGVVVLGITWKDPNAAAEWANALATRVNDRLRGRAQALAERNISYLESEIANTNVVTMQQSIGRVLEAEMQKLLMARGNEEFAFKVVDRAVPPKEHARPKRLLVVLAGFMAGGIISVLVVYGRRRLSKLSK